jgi:thiamine-phosphate pyrophosphorylase
MRLERHLDIMEASPFAAVKTSLYLICDGETCEAHGLSCEDFITGAVAGGAGMVQYRHKNISPAQYGKNLLNLKKICEGSKVTLIVNDHADIAEKFSLALHLGQGDVLPQNLTVPYGRSTHNFEELGLALAANPAPGYIALGTMFPSAVKPDVISARALVDEYLKRTALPVVLIGGITADNVNLLPQSPRISYAVISDAFRFGATKAGIEKYVRTWNSA